MAYDKMFVTMRVLDAYGRTKSKRVELVTTDPVQADLDSVIVVGAYDNVMEGAIQSSIVSGETSYVGTPAAGSNVDTGVTVSCQLHGRPDRAPLKWPTPDPAIIAPDGSLDLTNVNVVALEAIYDVTTPAIATLSDGETIDGFISGKLDK